MTKIVFATLLLAPIAYELGRATVMRKVGWPEYTGAISIILVGMWFLTLKK
jgi:hypothetical protein